MDLQETGSSYYLQSKKNKNIRKPNKKKGFFLARKEKYANCNCRCKVNKKRDCYDTGIDPILHSDLNKDNAGNTKSTCPPNYVIELDSSNPNNPNRCPLNCCPKDGGNSGLMSYLPADAFNNGGS